MTHTIPGPPPGAAARSDVLAELLLLRREVELEDDSDEDGDEEEEDEGMLELEDDEGMLELEDGELLEVELPELVLALPAVELPLVALLEGPLLSELLPPDFDLSTPPWWLHAPRPVLAEVVPSLHMTGALVEPDALLASCALTSGAIEMIAPSAAIPVSSLRRAPVARG